MNGTQATVNGRSVRLDGVSSHTNALDWLRGEGLTGCKEGCAEGECGACAVLVARPAAATSQEPRDGSDEGTVWTAVNACLVPAAALDGQEVVTAEGLGRPDDLHPVQQEMAVRGGSQCGYCTPGFVCSMAAEYYRPGRAAVDVPAATPAGHGHGEVGPNGFDLHALSGNLCRCTGYRPIRDAAYAVGAPAEDDPLARRRTAPAPAAAETHLDGPDGTFVRPRDLPETLRLLASRPDGVVVAGSTDWGVDVNIKGTRAPLLVAVDRLPELRELEVTSDHVLLGAALTLSELERGLAGRVPMLDQAFPQFASRLIRNSATIGGNLGTGSPIGDLPPALLALDAVLVLSSTEGEREVPLADYFTGYRQSVRRADELIRSVRIPLPLASVTAFHKVAKRRFDDISSVAVGYALDVEGGVVARARIGLGGVAATPVRAPATEAALEGRPWTEATVREAAEVMGREGTPMDDHRASARYRTAMLTQSLLKLHAESTTRTTAEEVGA
ncbi:MAG TPA: FAD binding domain-containing protein [Segeticoccus sp.]|nr:FAD binding domain-containing protein [Segeticoccus sp.]